MKDNLDDVIRALKLDDETRAMTLHVIVRGTLGDDDKLSLQEQEIIKRCVIVALQQHPLDRTARIPRIGDFVNILKKEKNPVAWDLAERLDANHKAMWRKINSELADEPELEIPI